MTSQGIIFIASFLFFSASGMLIYTQYFINDSNTEIKNTRKRLYQLISVLFITVATLLTAMDYLITKA